MPRQARPTALARAFGRRLRALREEAGLTQERLAWECGRTKGFLSEIESGRRFPSMPTLQLLAEKLGVALVDLFAVDADDPRHAVLDAMRKGDLATARAALDRLDAAGTEPRRPSTRRRTS